MPNIFLSLKNKNRFLIGFTITLFGLICLGIYRQQYLVIDSWFLNLFGARTNPYLNFLSTASYIIGDTYIAGAIVVIALAVMIWRNYRSQALAFAFATLGILILIDEVLKPLFDRNRPPKPRLVEDVSRHSFPSGHAAGNLVLYFYLSFVIATKYPKLKVYVYGAATIITISIGFASVYTKAHWLTDVLAGYIFGYLWLIVSLNVLKFLQRRSI